MRYQELVEYAKAIRLTDESGRTFKVVKNPSREDYLKLLDDSKENHLRGFSTDNELWIWDAYYGYHFNVANELGIDVENSINVHFFKNDEGSDEYDNWLIKNRKEIRRISPLAQDI